MHYCHHPIAELAPRARLSRSVGNECASPVAAAAGYEITVKFDRLAVVRAGQTATPTGAKKGTDGWDGEKGEKGNILSRFHSCGPCPTSGAGARVSGRAKPAGPLASEGTYLVTEISSPSLPFPIFSCRRVTSSNA